MADKSASDKKKCAHPSCRCSAKEGSDFCSTFCESAGKSPDVQCGCGHPECSSSTRL